MNLLLLDANSIVNRAFYGIKMLSTKDGQFTNGLVGFLNILLKLRDDVRPDGIVAAFDLPAPTFRHAEYADYKAGRKGMPDELAAQLPVLKDMLRLMGCHVVECEGYEADDILGTLAAAGTEACHIATGDRDALQLVSDRVTVLLATTKMGQPQTTVYDPAAVQDKYGLEPAQLIDLKALMGDASDHIPGVPGVGEKTALELMQRFGSLDAIYEDLDTLDVRDSLRDKLRAGRDSAFLSRRLGTICRAAPIDTDPHSYRQAAADGEGLSRLLARLEMFKLLEKMNLGAAASQAAMPAAETQAAGPAARPVEAEGAAALAAWRRSVEETGRVDVVAAAEEPAEGGLYALAEERPAALYAAFEGRVVKAAAGEAGYDEITAAVRGEGVAVRTADMKALLAALPSGSQLADRVIMDTHLAGYLLNPLASDYSLPRLAQEYAVPLPPGDVAAVQAAAVLPAVADRLAALLEEQEQAELLRAVELPLAAVLADMEAQGFEVDAGGIADFGRGLDRRIGELQRAVYEAVGYEFNLNSPKQLADAFFVKLGLKSGKKTKTGYSTNADVLEKLRDEHPAVSMLLDYRQLAKLKSTYCDGLLKAIGGDGRIHSSFNQTETRTGRISSTEPNLQNIPVRQELGREMRRFFRAREGWVLCDADYSQIELRVLAHMAGDRTMLDAFNSGTDIHRVTASQVFGVPEDEVTPLMRSRAKAVNFGIVYGIGPHSLSEDIGVSYSEARQYIEQYLAHYSGVAAFMDEMVRQAGETGYAKTLFGRRRPLPELRASGANMRAFGERVARNMPIQGTAADIIKIAMVRVWRRLRREGMAARLILQVHDELIVEAPQAEAEQAAALLHEEMEAAADLSVRLEADVHIGRTWYDAKG